MRRVMCALAVGALLVAAYDAAAQSQGTTQGRSTAQGGGTTQGWPASSSHVGRAFFAIG